MRKHGLTRTLGVLAALAVSGFAAAALATPSASPSKLCKAERADANFAAGHGGKTFAEHYGTNANKKNAFGKCVSAKAKAKPKPQQTTTTTQTTTTQATTTTQSIAQPSSAAAQAEANAMCKAELDDPTFAAGHGGKSFAQVYGTNKGQQNAFGICVSGKAKPAAS